MERLFEELAVVVMGRVESFRKPDTVDRGLFRPGRIAESIPGYTVLDIVADRWAKNSGRLDWPFADMARWKHHMAGDIGWQREHPADPGMSVNPRKVVEKQARKKTHKSTRRRRLSSTSRRPLLTTHPIRSLRPFRPMLRQPLLHIPHTLNLRLLRRRLSRPRTGRRIPSNSLPLHLRLLELRGHALVMALDDVLGNTLHAEDFEIQARPVREGVVDGGELFFVDLAHVDR